QTEPASRPTAGETEISSTPRALVTCSGVTLSGIRAAMPPSCPCSASSAPSSTRRSNASSPALRRSTRYGTFPATLLMPERDHRFDLHRLARGNLAGDESHDDQYHRRAGHGHGIVRRHADQLR